jgi:hypothetical protein
MNTNAVQSRSAEWDTSMPWPRTTWRQVTKALRGRRQDLTAIPEKSGVTKNVAVRAIQGTMVRGHIFYIYNTFRLANDVTVRHLLWCSQQPDFLPVANRLSEIVARFSHAPSPVELSRSIAALIASWPLGLGQLVILKLRPKLQRLSPNVLFNFPLSENSRSTGTVTPGISHDDKTSPISKYRIYLLSDDARNAPRLYPNSMAHYVYFEKEKYIEAHVVVPMREITKRDFARRFHSGLRVYGQPMGDEPKQFWKTAIKANWGKDTHGYSIGWQECTLRYYFYPSTVDVFTATVENMCGLLRWRDVLLASLNNCSRCGGQGAWECPHCRRCLCSACWETDENHGSLCRQLEQFGEPIPRQNTQ